MGKSAPPGSDAEEDEPGGSDGGAAASRGKAAPRKDGSEKTRKPKKKRGETDGDESAPEDEESEESAEPEADAARVDEPAPRRRAADGTESSRAVREGSAATPGGAAEGRKTRVAFESESEGRGDDGESDESDGARVRRHAERAAKGGSGARRTSDILDS